MKEMTCIICPRGCHLMVDSDLYGITVVGNSCPRGKEYAVSEFTNPVRTVTVNVRVDGGEQAVVSAKTEKPIPLSKVLPLAHLAKRVTVKAPVKIGDELHVLLGEKIIATANVDIVK